MGALVSCFSNILYISERLALCTVSTGLVCCLVLTITMTLGMGIGLGYNYCFVDMKTKYKYIKGHYVYSGSPQWLYPRTGNVAEEPEIEDIAEDDVLRRPLYMADDISSIADVITTSAGTETSVDYHLTFPDSETFNERKSSAKTTIDVAIDDTTFTTKSSPKTSSSTSSVILESSSTTASTTFSGSFDATQHAIVDASLSDIMTKRIMKPEERKDQRDQAIKGAKEQKKSTKAAKEASASAPKIDIKGESKEPIPKSPTLKDPTSRKVKKLVIPITGLDLISLLSQLRAENKNYSLQVVTT